MANLRFMILRSRLNGSSWGLEETLASPFTDLAAVYKRADENGTSTKEDTSFRIIKTRKDLFTCNIQESTNVFNKFFRAGRQNQLGLTKIQAMNYSCSAEVNTQDKSVTSEFSGRRGGAMREHQLGENVSKKEKITFLLNTLPHLKNNKEAIYGALDAWVAWEHNFPIASLKRILLTLEKEEQWHRVIQVIKWILSKGQGATMGTYSQLIRALDKDHRAEEAHKFWVKKIGADLHSVPWQLCHLMISIYSRNNKLEHLVKLFKGLEAFDRKPPEKSIVQKVADAYELLGLVQEKERVMEKYNYLFTERESFKKSKKDKLKEKKKSGQDNQLSSSDGRLIAKDNDGLTAECQTS